MCRIKPILYTNLIKQKLMKKIFTLCAVIAMTLAAGAQEKALFDYSVTYADGQTISSANAKLTLGNDMKAWKTGASKIAADGYLSEFGQTVTVTTDDGDVEQFSAITVNGSNNPKDQAESGKGSGINCAEGKTSARLPQNGSYYIFNPAANGKVQIGIVLNADKAFYLIDATGAVTNESGYLEVSLPDANLHNYVVKNASGEEVELADDGDAKGGKISSEKVTGTLEFEVEGGKTYYFFCTGSKLGCFGYIFTPAGGETSNGIIWEGDGSAGAVSWNGIYRFALEGHDGANECIAEIPQAIWDKMMTEAFYLDIQSENPQIRITNGWWDVNWKDDIMPGNELLTNNGDGTWTVEINLTDNPDFIATLLEKHLLFTGDRYTPVKIYFKNGDTPGPGPEIEDGWMELVHNGNAEGSDGASLVCKNGDNPDNLFFNVLEGVGVDGSRCVAVTSAVGATNDWDAQFFIYAPDYEFKMGDQYKVSYMVKASTNVELPGPQAHTTPGNYIGWYIDGSSAVNLTTEWQEVSFQGTVNDSMEAYGGVMNGMSTLAFTLNTDKTQSITYYFDNVSWKVKVDDSGVKELNTVQQMNGPKYNLAGMRVGDDYKGVVIQNGRKFIQK